LTDCVFNLKERGDGRRRGVMIVCTNKKKGKVVWEKEIKMTRR
jgi:hypothetical protein